MFAKGAWLPQWQKRKLGSGLADAAQRLGATMLITEFYKGFGRKIEQEVWPDLAGFVQRCHERGIKVWGYAQGCSLFYEMLGEEIPHWKNWAARKWDGSLGTFANTYFRCAPCLNSEEFGGYFAGVVNDGIDIVGLDGVHLDNSYYEHCWCERCSALFREWLDQRGDLEERTGIRTAKHIIPPPFPGKNWAGLDPLQILWLEFGVETRLRFFRRLSEHIKARHPGIIISGNPGLPRGDAFRMLRCVEPSREHEAFDFFCTENGNQPRIEGGWIGTQAEAHLLAEAGKYRTFVTSWRTRESTVLPPHPPGGVWAGLAEEFSFDGVLGNNWAFRPAGEGDRFWIEEQPEMEASFTEALSYFKSLQAAVGGGRRKTYAEVAIWYDAYSASIFGNSEVRLNIALQQYLLRHGIPFLFALPGAPLPSSIRTLVVFHVGALSDARLSEIHSFGATPGRTVWMAGYSGRTDEWFVPRERSSLQSIRRQEGIVWTEGYGDHWHEAFSQPAARHSDSSAYFETQRDSLQAADNAVCDAFFQTEHFQTAMRFDRPPHVLVHSQTDEAGRLFFHFRDQSGSGDLIEGVKIHFLDAQDAHATARVFSPGREAQSLPLGPILSVPPFAHYSLVLVENSVRPPAG